MRSIIRGSLVLMACVFIKGKSVPVDSFAYLANVRKIDNVDTLSLAKCDIVVASNDPPVFNYAIVDPLVVNTSVGSLINAGGFSFDIAETLSVVEAARSRNRFVVVIILNDGVMLFDTLAGQG